MTTILPPRARARWSSERRPGRRHARRGRTTGRANRHAIGRRWARRLPGAGLVGLLIVLLLGAGLASAAWLSSGSGNGTARGGQGLAPTTTTVAGSAITTNLLYPGGTGDVKITVNNPNPYPVTVASVAPNGAVTAVAGSGTGTCATTGVALTTTAPATPITANGSATLTLAGAATMTNASDTGCQNATFTIPVTVAITSA